ncbi:MAG: MoxR family ATPase [Planctomycetes bacterium]|nr:MoxR family ATPase [Planctomycetota bacterium]
MENNPNDYKPRQLASDLDKYRDKFQELLEGIQQAIVGYEDLITDTLVALSSQGHVLLEGAPGLGKTYLVRVIAQVLGLSFGRIQCTPDLMPSDILGTHIVTEDENGRRVFRFEKGPVFKHLLLVDEINRATPKTQAALLEVMQERRVTAGGESFELPAPFFVLATQNPIEMEGTYPLPEAQLDRFFFKLNVPYPGRKELVEISRRTTKFQEPQLDVVMSGEELIDAQELLTHVPIADPLTSYGAAVILGTHPDNTDIPSVRRYVSYGASPRGLQALVRGARAHSVLAGRTAVSVEDLHRVAKQALRHRIILNFEGEAESIQTSTLIEEILEEVPTPARESV